MLYTMRAFFLVLVLMTISACSAGFNMNSTSEEPAKTAQKQEQQQEKPKMASTTTKSSEFASTIIKDERTGIIPVSIEIPAIDLKAPTVGVGLKENGEMDVTESFKETFWFDKGYKPGEPGNAVIGGHVDSKKGPAIFYNIKKLQVGDEVIVSGKDGDKRTFVVTDKKAYPWDEAPLKSIFGYTSRSSLNLITCTGNFDHAAHNYSQRLVIYTELKS